MKNTIKLLAGRVMSLSATIHSDEIGPTLKLALRIFLILFAYYLLKPAREAFILTDGSAELRSYSVALQALVLFIVIPLYSTLYKRVAGEKLYNRITLFFVVTLLGFWLLGVNGMAISVPFFIWLGIFSVTQVAQFWALVTDLHHPKSGKRLFAIIGFGGSLGAVLGSSFASELFVYFGPYNLLLLAAVILLLSSIAVRVKATNSSAATQAAKAVDWHAMLGGLHLVIKLPYLRILAIFVVLLNCVNSIGEYILASMVVDHFAAITTSSERGILIGEFYSDFFFWVNLASLLLQFFIVSRIYRLIGVSGAILLLPLITTIGYTLIAFFPIFAVVRMIKIIENSTDYSITATSRHALFLPVCTDSKYLGKTTIDTFFWRLGDLIQAGIVFAGTTLFKLELGAFAMLNVLLSLLWLWVGIRIGRYYKHYTRQSALTGTIDMSKPVLSKKQSP
ncbi:MAG: hypothetical protein L3J84_06060 [Gammaproteobacteria bacterium]|nr:hypothetical protein [Gammaproteobacteria bacterium]